MIITLDNPRTEDPQQIIRDMTEQVSAAEQTKIQIEVQRREAIHRALSQAKPRDVILIAGKGHEEYQIIGEEKLAFSDLQVAKEVLK